MNTNGVFRLGNGSLVVAVLLVSGCTTFAGVTPDRTGPVPVLDGYVLCTGGTASLISSQRDVGRVCGRIDRHGGIL